MIDHLVNGGDYSITTDLYTDAPCPFGWERGREEERRVWMVWCLLWIRAFLAYQSLLGRNLIGHWQRRFVQHFRPKTLSSNFAEGHSCYMSAMLPGSLRCGSFSKIHGILSALLIKWSCECSLGPDASNNKHSQRINSRSDKETPIGPKSVMLFNK